MNRGRHARQMKVRRRRALVRRYTIGPYSWLGRLRDAALDEHTCVWIEVPKWP